MLILMLHDSCYNYSYDKNAQVPSSKDAGVRLFITDNGINQYCAININLGIEKIDTSKLSINFPIIGFEITLDEAKFLQLEINNITFTILNNTARAAINDINIEMYFRLQISQKTFPYLHDDGSLSIKMIKVGFTSTLTIAYPEQDCKQKFEILRQQSTIYIKQFSFQFTCGMQIILNSISSLLVGVLQEQLNGALGDSIADIIIGQMIRILKTMKQIAGVNRDTLIKSDQRIINGVDLVQNFFVIYFTGQRFQMHDKHLSGWLDDEIGKPVSFVTSNDLQYQIEKIVFNSGFKLYLEQNKTRCTPSNICITDIKLERFHNTGAKVVVNITLEGKNQTLTFLEPVKVSKVDIGSNNFFIVFGVRFTNLIQGELEPQYLEELSSYFDDSFKEFDYAVDNFAGGSEKSIIVVYLDANWIHVGANFGKD